MQSYMLGFSLDSLKFDLFLRLSYQPITKSFLFKIFNYCARSDWLVVRAQISPIFLSSKKLIQQLIQLIQHN